MTQYSVYKTDELFQKFSEITEQSEDVNKFFTNFKFNTITKKNEAVGTSSHVFNNIIKHDTTKAKIISLLNKLHGQNITKVIAGIREIVIQTEEELNELVNQCILKMKRDTNEIKPLVAKLCYELQTTYFDTKEGDKIYFRKILLSEIKKDYVYCVNYNSSEWNKEKSDKIMIMIGIMFNNEVIDSKIMGSIIKDFRKMIEYKPNQEKVYYEKVEKAILQLSSLVSSIILNEESKKIYGDLDVFLDTQITLMDENNNIVNRNRLTCKNTIAELRK